MKHNFERFCKDYENIENYDKAKKDNFKGWECHHRLETHTPDGKRREVDISYKELIALNLYYHRPAEELIFLTTREHYIYRKGKPKSEEHKKKISEAQKGKQLSEEHKKKISEAKKGEKHPNYGKHFSEEYKKKLSEALKGHPVSEETRNKIGTANKGNTYAKGNKSTKGMCWFNNGKINKVCYECPPGFTPGRLRK